MTLYKDKSGRGLHFALDATIPFLTDVIQFKQIWGDIPVINFILND